MSIPQRICRRVEDRFANAWRKILLRARPKILAHNRVLNSLYYTRADGESPYVSWPHSAVSVSIFRHQTAGISMLGLIPEGAHVVLRKLGGGGLEGKTLLIQRNDMADPESGGAYTIKTYMREGVRIVLRAKNPAYDIEIADDAEYSVRFRAIAEFKCVL